MRVETHSHRRTHTSIQSHRHVTMWESSCHPSDFLHLYIFHLHTISIFTLRLILVVFAVSKKKKDCMLRSNCVQNTNTIY